MTHASGHGSDICYCGDFRSEHKPKCLVGCGCSEFRFSRAATKGDAVIWAEYHAPGRHRAPTQVREVAAYQFALNWIAAHGSYFRELKEVAEMLEAYAESLRKERDAQGHCDLCREPVRGSVHYELVSGKHRCIRCMNRLDEPLNISGPAEQAKGARAALESTKD